MKKRYFALIVVLILVVCAFVPCFAFGANTTSYTITTPTYNVGLFLPITDFDPVEVDRVPTDYDYSSVVSLMSLSYLVVGNSLESFELTFADGMRGFGSYSDYICTFTKPRDRLQTAFYYDNWSGNECYNDVYFNVFYNENVIPNSMEPFAFSITYDMMGISEFGTFRLWDDRNGDFYVPTEYGASGDYPVVYEDEDRVYDACVCRYSWIAESYTIVVEFPVMCGVSFYERNLSVESPYYHTYNSNFYYTTYTNNNAYNQGKNDGIAFADSRLNENSFSYLKGVEDGEVLAGEYTFRGLLFSAIDAPVNAAMELFNFDLLGVNLRGLIATLFTLAVIIIILRMALFR